MSYLSGKHRAIALDTPGFGQSFLPAGSPSTTDYAKWLLAALDALTIDECHLAAHHTGTHFAAEMAALAPERILSLTLSGVLYADQAKRQEIRDDIGNAPSIDVGGSHLLDTWDLMKRLYPDYDAQLVQQETLGALASAAGRNQAFDAIFEQDFASVFRGVKCPVTIAQASDDPLSLMGFLDAFKGDFPDIQVCTLGPGFLAVPERQPGQFARELLTTVATATHSANTLEDASMSNRFYHYERTPSQFSLILKTGARPEPGPGEVLVKVHAVSLNRRDASIRDLSYPVSADAFIPFSDAAGEVVAVGADVQEWRVGDRVMSAFFQNWRDGRLNLSGAMSALGGGGPGVLSEYAILSEQGLVKLPDDWSYAEGACMPCAATTAWNGLMTQGQLQAGDDVLIIGTGGVALFGIQIAAAAGANPIVLSSSDVKMERAKSLGAKATINYKTTPQRSETVRELTHGAGVAQVLELGGAGTLEQSVASLGLNGHLAMIGALDGFGGQIQAVPLIFSALKISAIMVGSQADHEVVTTFMSNHDLRPVIDTVFPFDEVESAFERLNSGAFGKVVVSLT